MRTFHNRLIFFVCISLVFSGCAHHDYHDPTLMKKEDAYEADLTESVVEESPAFTPPILKDDIPPKAKVPLSIKIKGSLPLKQAVAFLEESSGVRIMLDKSIHDEVFIKTKNQTLVNVLQDVCLENHFICKWKEGRAHIMPDRFYAQTYNLQFLNGKRQNDSELAIETDIFSNHAHEKNIMGQGNGSATKITSSATTDFWHELEENLKMMLLPEVQASSEGGVAKYTLHKQAGLLTIYAKNGQHEQIQDYIKTLKENVGTQVLIEAKIIEINLSKQYSSGIDWFFVRKHLAVSAPLGSLAHPGGIDTVNFATRNVVTLGKYGGNLSGLVNFLSSFGTVRTLSNPRLTVLNNHPALLKVATNYVYFKVNYNREFNADGRAGFERASSQVHTVPVGLILSVHPAINFETGEITLSLRPTISRIVDSVEDPAVGILTGNAKTSKIPVVQMREMDSVVQLKSGGVVILGGLMEERSDNTQNRIPIPGFDNVLRAKDDNREITELVILLRAQILTNGASGLSLADKNIYTNFTKDPRKIKI